MYAMLAGDRRKDALMPRLIRQLLVLLGFLVAAANGSVAAWSSAPTAAVAVADGTSNTITLNGFVQNYRG